MQRRKPIIPKISNIRPELPQAINQIANWPFVHAGNAFEHIIATSQRQSCCQWSESGASITEKKLSLLDREMPAAAFDQPVSPTLCRHTNTQGFQSLQHALSIIGGQQITHLGFPAGQRRQQQDTIGNTL